jgi:hypothetical protein
MRIWLAMKRLLQTNSYIEKLRFWGKIFGRDNDYYIVEADLNTFDALNPMDNIESVQYEQVNVRRHVMNESDERNNESQRSPPETIDYAINQKLFYVATGRS